mgnify:CR=1 FL=1
MSGLVGVIANDSARYSLFSSCIDRLVLPEGWKKEWLIGGDWCGARNALCRLVLEEDYEYLWFMDDDHAFAPSLLTKLLAHDEALVTPICLTRVHPFKPVQYIERDESGEYQYLPIQLENSPDNGLVEIQAGGCAGMLIRRDVIEAIEPPWFEYADRSEDIIFCEKAKAAGFKLHADLSCRLGHITTAVVEPAVRGGDWQTGLTIGRDLRVMIDVDENVVVEKPGAPATVQTWIWELRNVLSHTTLFRLLLPAATPFNFQPLGDFADIGTVQWYCDSGDGFEKVGDQFYPALQ